MKSPFFHVIAAIILCIITIVGYGMWYAAIAAKSAAAAALQSTIDTKTETMNRIATTRATLADIANDETVVQNYFVPEAGVVAFINSLEAHGKTLGTAVNVLSVSTAGTKIQPALSLSLVIGGSFNAVMRTVGAIEYAPYDLSISALSVTQDENKNWRANLKLLVGSVPVMRTATITP